ncbi:MAG: DUF6328 family protein [Promicromonosporaceae bacterium]|nr:DUF6328 family protein [Promicromonosporaceae bacterium]
MTTNIPAADAEPREQLETPAQRADRNWSELLQELRVMQTGVQILTGFLLTLPFQTVFATLTTWQRGLYLVLVGVAATTTGLVIAPVSIHRALFRKRRKPVVVREADHLMRVALVMLGLLVAGVTSFVFDVVVSHAAGLIAGGVALAGLLGLWLVMPEVMLRKPPPVGPSPATAPPPA